MKRMIKASKFEMNKVLPDNHYLIADCDGIPLRSQPEEGYTKLQVISAIHRHAEEDAKLFGGKYTDYIHYYCVLDNRMHDVTKEFYDLV